MSTILLVDDEQDLLDLFTEVLEQMDHRVLIAHDGQEALSIAQQKAPDLVVTDWMMPRMDGLELCHQLHGDAHLKGLPIILHSSSGNPHAPGTQFVSKSCSLEEFGSLVNRVLASSTHVRKPARPEAALRSSRLSHTTLIFGLGEAACTTAH
ncbi:response regulator [Stigmatella aurantiaca]|uniref:Response regulator n=1 Tax=Stigmatella aurantiaca (strain DW4/3-1) TaxID=378806 RepID=Q08YT7_STIAD|nr:response regulator [Stigmatella aurantiaca]ADO72050.1 response regulator [Stigmatella aurantiaca DW4/3-1]EAU65619.1 phosphate regulon response regulator PhoB [Stigmatella aurantiaca DW4/3-1]